MSAAGAQWDWTTLEQAAGSPASPWAEARYGRFLWREKCSLAAGTQQVWPRTEPEYRPKRGPAVVELYTAPLLGST